MQSSSAQRHRVNRVINFARDHIANPLNLDALADVACLSKFHFARMFQNRIGKTPLEYVSYLRLESAARTLFYHTEKPITQIAFDCGFSSSQSFSRAFHRRFGVSPRDFRGSDFWIRNPLPGTVMPEQVRDRQSLHWAGQFIADPISRARVRVEERPAYRVAYIRFFGPYFNADGGMTATRRRLIQWARRKGLWHENADMIGLCPNNPALTPAQHCQYDVCISVPDHVREDDVVSIQTIPAGTYAVARFDFLESGLSIYSIWEWLAELWLPELGAASDLSTGYEYYPAENGIPGGLGPRVEVCLRLAER